MAAFRPSADGLSNNEGQRPWMGVVMAETEGQAGARIERVHPEGPAGQAGLQSGDVIVQFDGKQVGNPTFVSEAISTARPNQHVDVVVLRDGQRHSFDLALSNRNEFLRSHSDDFAYDTGEDSASLETSEYTLRLEQHKHLAQQHQRIEDLCHQLLNEVKDLREQVEHLQQSN